MTHWDDDELVGDEDLAVAMKIDPGTFEFARANLEKAGYGFCGFEKVARCIKAQTEAPLKRQFNPDGFACPRVRPKA